MIVLPRHAQDKHREILNKRCFSQARPSSATSAHNGSASSSKLRSENAIFAMPFYQDRLGTCIGKALKKERRFFLQAADPTAPPFFAYIAPHAPHTSPAGQSMVAPWYTNALPGKQKRLPFFPFSRSFSQNKHDETNTMKQTRFLSRFFKYQDRLRTKNKCKESSSKKKTPSQGSRRRAHRMRKNGLFGAIYIYLKTIFLPRQARDKHSAGKALETTPFSQVLRSCGS